MSGLISGLIGQLGKVGIIVGLVIIIVVVWFISGTMVSYYPALGQTGGAIIGIIFVVILVYLFCRYGPKI